MSDSLLFGIIGVALSATAIFQQMQINKLRQDADFLLKTIKILAEQTEAVSQNLLNFIKKLWG